jgi:hypothetical protein
MDAFRTPPGYFDSLPDRIVARTKTRVVRLRAASAALLLLPELVHQEETCVSFACLLDATSTEELLHDDLLEELAEDPAAFDVLTEDL